MKNLLIGLGILVVIIWFGMSAYNGLVAKDETVKKAWANVQTQYQRRADLIGNLVNTVKGAANFEQKTLTDVINARASATQMKIDIDDLTPEKLAQYQAAQGQLGQALGRLMMITENYPELKSTELFKGLMDDLSGSENRVASARKDYNDVVQEFNTKVRSFPTNIFAGMFGMKMRPAFEADAASQKAPEVKF